MRGLEKVLNWGERVRTGRQLLEENSPMMLCEIKRDTDMSFGSGESLRVQYSLLYTLPPNVKAAVERGHFDEQSREKVQFIIFSLKARWASLEDGSGSFSSTLRRHTGPQ
ncbi:hypothetical protein SKAU_G00045820 [Synaphobranchus kaupii]|uniref:Uncharacterized protein n=1 Tax=Synaphobranchus kaupii TaxID=118154 RepID=A0A9Q1G224_SYNKA|nr:hypothetical protein SKAU_G00045820 [Synaphobranchus kaupii]